jgi:hypothetical protein
LHTFVAWLTLDLFADMHYARRRRIIMFRNLMRFLTGGDAA